MAYYSIHGGFKKDGGFLKTLPGQPFIEEAIINSIITFNYRTFEKGDPRYGENHSSRMSVVCLLIAFESMVNAAIHLKKLDIKGREKILVNICNSSLDISNGFQLWEELLKVRDSLVHGHLYYLENNKYTPSKLTKQFAHSKRKMKYINPQNNKTKIWELSINPLKVGKYECICSLTLWEWLNRNLDDKIKGYPLPTYEPFGIVMGDDRIDKCKDLKNWLDLEKLDFYLKRNGSIDEYIAVIYGRLNKRAQKIFRDKYQNLINEDIHEIWELDEANK